MNKLKVLIILPLLFLSALLGVATIHAAALGTVCVVDSAAPADCSTAPATVPLAGPLAGKVGTQFTVAVNLAGSDPTNGFDIQVFADTSFLNASMGASSVSLSGSVLPGASIFLECVNGLIVIGSGVCSPTDGLGVVHVVAGQASIVSSPVTGRLFTITYSIVGQTGGTPIHLQNVSIFAGNQAQSESLVDATFVNLADFTLALSPASQSFIPGGSRSLTETLTVLGAFSDTLSLVTSVSPTTGLTVTCPTSTTLPPSQTLSCTLVSGSTVPSPTTFTITVKATGTTSLTSHTATATVIVSVPDFTITPSTAELTIDRGFSGSQSLTIGALSSFANTVNLAATSSSPSVSAIVTPNMIPFASGSASVQVAVAGNAAFADYKVTVTGTSTGAGPHSTVITVHVISPDFSVIAINSAIVTLPPLSGVSAVLVTSLHQFAGTVNLSTLVTPNGLSSPTVPGFTTGTFVPGTVNPVVNPAMVTLTPGSTALTTLTITTVVGAALGNYTISVRAANSTVTRSADVSITLEDFLVSLEGNKTHMVSVPGTFDKVFIDGFSLGGATGFGTFGEFIGLNCVRNRVIFRVNLVLGRPIASTGCYLLNTGTVPTVFFANGTAVPEAFLFAHGPYIRCAANFCGLSPVPAFFNTFPNPDPTTFVNFCDSLGLNLDCSDTNFFRAIPFADTLPGDYILRIAGGFGAIKHSLPDITLHIPAAPQFNQFNWKHLLSFSKSGGVQIFRAGITNVDNQTTLFINVQIKGFFANGLPAFVVNSMTTNGVIALAPGQTINNILTPWTFDNTSVGQTISFSAVIRYGLSSTRLRATSTAEIPIDPPPISGSFTIVP